MERFRVEEKTEYIGTKDQVVWYIVDATPAGSRYPMPIARFLDGKLAYVARDALNKYKKPLKRKGNDQISSKITRRKRTR